MHFDLDPTPGADFPLVHRAALLIPDALLQLGVPSYPKTTWSRGIHVYVPIIRGPFAEAGLDGTRLERWRPDKVPKQCTMEQVEASARSPLTLLRESA